MSKQGGTVDKIIDVQEIIIEWLTEDGYDGLYRNNECCCKIEDIGPDHCSKNAFKCTPGYLQPDPTGEVGDWKIGPMDEESVKRKRRRRIEKVIKFNEKCNDLISELDEDDAGNVVKFKLN